MRVLFICSRNRLRSSTAEVVFSSFEGVEALSAGIRRDADSQLSSDLVEWAEIIFAMESSHRREIQRKFGSLLQAKKIVVLGIRDNYKYMDPELVKILREKVTPYLSDRK